MQESGMSDTDMPSVLECPSFIEVRQLNWTTCKWNLVKIQIHLPPPPTKKNAMSEPKEKTTFVKKKIVQPKFLP